MRRSSATCAGWRRRTPLGQDVLLLGAAGDLRRELVLRYCEMAGRGVEHVVVSGETAEADFTQRRELRGRSSVLVDGPAVRAALLGRVLLVEGLERAERNVLPVLNNLLENRELNLDDGRFLVAPGSREKWPPDADADPAAARVVQVHPAFRVVALALSAARYPGRQPHRPAVALALPVPRPVLL
jgi:hypothetical protein